MTQASESAAAMLSRLLTRPDTLEPRHLPLVRANWLSGYVYFALPEAHPLRPALRTGMLELGLRHALIRTELRELLSAWASEGLPCVLLKGFALAEFEYAHPSERFYGDVDLLLPDDPAVVMRAVHLALALGWRSDGLHAEHDAWTHESAHLFSPGGQARLDVHRWVVTPVTGAGNARAKALSAQVWAGQRQVEWEGLTVALPDPLDAAIIGVALGRCWSGDLGALKPADYTDLQVLARNHRLTPALLREHARKSGASHTWDALCQCCDPGSGHLELHSDIIRPLLRLGVERDDIRPERARWQRFARKVPAVLPRLPQALLDVLAAWWMLRQGGDPRAPLRRWTPAGPTKRLSARRLQGEIAAINWWTSLLYPRQSRRGVCVPRAYAVYRSLRRAGHPAVFVSGVTRTASGVTGHAWVEEKTGVMEDYGEPYNRQVFQVVFQYPEAAALL